MQDLVFNGLESLLVLVHLDNNLLTLGLDLRLFLHYDISEQLLLQTRRRHSEVDQCDLNADFRRIVRVWHLCSHEQFEAVNELIGLFLVQLDLPSAILIQELLMQENGVNARLNLLLKILDKKWLSIVDAVRHRSQESS